MSSGLLSIGASALDAAYTALRTTGNNIANVNTPGYTRELTTFTPQIATGLGNMYLGTGVTASSVTRMYNDFLGQQTNLAQSQASQADTAATLTGQINGLFSNTATGLGAAMDNFFSQIQSLTTQPGNAAVRQSVLSAAQQMTGQFNNFSAQLQQMNTSTKQQLGQQISDVNTIVAQIGQLNSQISLATASGGSPNTLLDQRNQAILTLNQSIGVTSEPQASGDINIFLANGQPLVVGSQTYTLAMGTNPINQQQVVVGTSSAGGAIAALDPNNSGGGSIGALLQFQNQTLPGVQAQIGQLAVVLSSQMNALQAQGMNLNNQAGTNFFTPPSISVTSAGINPDPGVLVSATYSDVTKLQASDYQLTIQGGSGNYTLTRLSDGTTVKQGTTASLVTNGGVISGVDGMNLTVAGLSGTTPASGSTDMFTIQPVSFAAGQMNVAITQGAQIAAAGPGLAATISAGSTLTGATVSPQPVSAYPSAQLMQPVTISFGAGGTYTSSAGNGTYTPGQPINLNGWVLNLTGTPKSGDSVSVAPTSTSSTVTGDNTNALQMAQLQSLGVVSGSSLDSGYANVIASVGALSSTANMDQTSKDAILQSASSAQSAVSGVNLDEEASHLLQYQQQYQAAAKIIQTATNVFDSILAVAAAA